MTSERFLGLDVVRTLAIGCVLLCHAIMLYGVLFPVTVPVAIASTLFGYYGVELFFALSGLLIGGILFQDVLPVPGVRSVGRFLLRRWLRILPAYYAVLAILLTVEWWRNGGVGVRWEYVFLVQNYNHGAEGFFPASWSLPIEQWAYILAPLALMVLPRLLSPWVKDQERQIWCSLGLVIGFFALFRLGVVLFAEPAWDIGIRKQIHLRLDAVFFGIVIAACRHYRPVLYAQLGRPAFFLSVLALLGLLLWWQASVMFGNATPGGPEASVFHKTLGFPVTDLLLALLLPFCALHSLWQGMAAHLPRLSSLFSGGSRYAYSLYLVHFSVYATVREGLVVWNPVSFPFRVLAVFVAVFAAVFGSLVLAFLLYRLVEKPGMDLRRFVG